jgi:hypothetical protein
MKGLLKPKLLFSLVAAVLLVSTLAVSPLLGSVRRSQALGPASRLQTLVVFEHYTEFKHIAVGTSDDPRGNYSVFDDPVFDATDTHQIGESSGSCVHTSKVRLQLEECNIILMLPGGQIPLIGLAEGSVTETYAVTGGTGIYKGVDGQVEVSVLTKKPIFEFKYIFHFG